MSMQPKLKRLLEAVDARRHAVRANRATAAVWVAFAAVGAVLFGVRASLGDALLPVAVGVFLVAACTAFVVHRRVSRQRGDLLDVARSVEGEYGELEASLLAATELEPDLPGGRYGYLSKRLLQRVLGHARREPWTGIVPSGELNVARFLHAASVATCLLLAFLMVRVPPAAETTSSGGGPGGVETAALEQNEAVVVLPGDADVERGRTVLVSAEFPGSNVPASAELVVFEADGTETVLPMTRSLDDPIFAGRTSPVVQDSSYAVRWSDGRTPTYTLSVFEFPELLKSDLTLRYPEYVGLPERTIEDTRRVTVPVGTELTLVCRLNKNVDSATLLAQNEGRAVSLERAAGDEPVYRATLVMEESKRYELVLVDAEGRRNQSRTRFVFRVTPNRRPELVASVRDVRVSPLEELELKAEISDDFGLPKFGIGYRLGGGETVDVELGVGDEGTDATAAHTIALEELNAEPAELLSFHFWAEDLDENGDPRRTTSDLYFAEVRPFEEIFREAPPQAEGEGGEQEQNPGGEGMTPPGADAQRLTELQRDVILATWNVIRAEVDDAETLRSEVEVVRDAQEEVKDGLGELAMSLAMAGGGGAEAGSILERVESEIDRALVELNRAHQDISVQPLHDALAPEQAAYEGLLELREQEFQVGRANQPQSSSRANASGGPSQAQLSQLELSSSENRYETESQAREARDDASRETRQALSRLKELARRQEDLNDRLRELQSELEAAETEEEREEIRRRLERLQEAQEEILRDTDELQQRMESSTQRERVAEEEQRLESTRESVRRASEALEEGQLSRALTEGSRASRGLEELEEELRDAASGQFDDRMREMQREARRLEQEQERLAQELREAESEDEAPSLVDEGTRDAARREALARDFERQGAGLEELLEDVEETLTDAEETEPLLAEDLFDALNDARRRRIEEALEATEELLARGFPEEAERSEGEAREGLRELRGGIDRAAESVLGSGVEALERAQEELERLASELDGELARARGESDPEEANADQPRAGGERPPTEGEPSQQGSGEPQPGEGASQPGEDASQPGEGQPSPSGEGRSSRPGERVRPSLTGPTTPEDATDRNRSAQRGATETRGGRGASGGRVAPLTGEDFLDWSDRLRDVEEMLDDPDLNAEAARIRGRARLTREDFKRHSREPNWDVVEERISQPLVELGRLVEEELRRRRAEDTLAPIDRDPVPPEFAEDVRRYYENLGRRR